MPNETKEDRCELLGRVFSNCGAALCGREDVVCSFLGQPATKTVRRVNGSCVRRGCFLPPVGSLGQKCRCHYSSPVFHLSLCVMLKPKQVV